MCNTVHNLLVELVCHVAFQTAKCVVFFQLLLRVFCCCSAVAVQICFCSRSRWTLGRHRLLAGWPNWIESNAWSCTCTSHMSYGIVL